MVGIVVVSHSRPLAEAAVRLALEMVAGDRPPIAVAAGTADGGTGTDAVAVAEAIAEADRGDGTVIITDLGSALLSAELALELLEDPALRARARIVPAPFVEGLLAAVVRAAGGATAAEVAAEASGALGPKLDHLGVPDADSPAEEMPRAGEPEVAIEAVLVNESGLHARPAALLATAAAGFSAEITVSTAAKGPVSAKSPIGLATLNGRRGDTVTITSTGSDARVAADAIAALIASGFGEGELGESEKSSAAASGTAAEARTGPGTTAPSDSTAPADTTEPAGRLGVSPGRVIGPVIHMPAPIAEPDASVVLTAAERADAAVRLVEAATRVSRRLQDRAESAPGDAGDILRANAAMAVDPTVLETATQMVRETGRTPESAAWATIQLSVDLLHELGGRMRERVTDLLDVRGRIVAELLGVDAPGIPASDRPFILVADDLAPADTATLDPALCLALVTARGGPTSHTAILARSLGIPAVVGAADAASFPAGATLLVDGDTGELILDPNEEQAATARPGLRTLAPLDGPGHTSDGHAVSLLANVGGAADVAKAVERGAEGVGLFRTEFSFLDRAEAPTVEEQVEAYRPVLAGFAGKHVVVRTLDAGSDKPMPFLTEKEPNPALGVRGFRTAAAHPQLLDDQLRAIATAASAEDADVWVMAPMIATVGEAADFASRAHAAGLRMAGIMIETPSAALQAEDIMHHVDFVSLGTNDLTQYTLAADRLSSTLAPFNDPWQPSVLRLIGQVGAAGQASGTPVGVCGEAAATPLLAQVLVGLGVTSLSMSALAIPLVGAALARVDLAACRRAAEAAIRADTAADARRAAEAALHS